MGVEAEMAYRVPRFRAGRQDSAREGGWQREARLRASNVIEERNGRRSQEACGADVQRQMNGQQVAHHLGGGCRLESGVQKAVPDGVVDVTEGLYD